MKNWNVLSMSFACCFTACASSVGGPDDGMLEDSPTVGLQPQALEAAEFFVFRNENSKRCMGVDRASTDPGARIQQFDCDCTANQQWRLDTEHVVIADHLALVNGKSQLCIGVDGASTSAGANLSQFGCDQRANQQWAYEELGENALGEMTIRFRNAKSKLCMGIGGGSQANGAQVQQFECDTRQNQRWVVHSPAFCSL
jgi:glucosylceramidase